MTRDLPYEALVYFLNRTPKIVVVLATCTPLSYIGVLKAGPARAGPGFSPIWAGYCPWAWPGSKLLARLMVQDWISDRNLEAGEFIYPNK